MEKAFHDAAVARRVEQYSSIAQQVYDREGVYLDVQKIIATLKVEPRLFFQLLIVISGLAGIIDWYMSDAFVRTYVERFVGSDNGAIRWYISNPFIHGVGLIALIVTPLIIPISIKLFPAEKVLTRWEEWQKVFGLDIKSSLSLSTQFVLWLVWELMLLGLLGIPVSFIKQEFQISTLGLPAGLVLTSIVNRVQSSRFPLEQRILNYLEFNYPGFKEFYYRWKQHRIS